MTEYVLARTGENNPLGDGWGSFAAPSVARVGGSFDVIFEAGAGASPSYQGIYVDRAVTISTLPPASLITTLDTITVPGLGSNLPITNAGTATQEAINGSGATAFAINVSLGTKQVLLTKGPGVADLLRVVSYEGIPFTGSQSGSVLVAASPFAIAADGDVGFRASTSTGTPNSTGLFRWDAQSSAIHLVIHTDDSAIGTNDKFNLIAHPTNQPYVAEFGDTARAAFRATTKDPGTSMRGIWVDHPVAGLSHVMDTTDLAPGVTPQALFVDFHAPAVNSLGQIAFRGCLPGGSACANDGIWSGSPGAVVLVTRQGSPAPGPDGNPTLDNFADFSNPVLNDDGAIAFHASAGGYEGVWRKANQFGAGLRRVVKQGDALRGTSVQSVSFGPDIAISDSGELAFTATMSDNEVALFTTSQLGENPQIVKIVKTGEAFAFTQTTMKTISNITFHPGAYAMGTTGFIHVSSMPAQPQAVAFALAFDEDNARALVLSTVE